MKLLKFHLILMSIQFLSSVSFGSYKHHWPIGENMCRGAWLGSKHYLDVEVIPNGDGPYTEYYTEKDWVTVLENGTNQPKVESHYYVGYPDKNNPHRVDQNSYNKGIEENDPLVRAKMHEVCEKAKQEKIEEIKSQGYRAINVTVTPFVNRHPGPHIDQKLINPGTPRYTQKLDEYSHYYSSDHLYTFVLHIDCHLTWHIQKYEDVTKEKTIYKDKYLWKKSDHTKIALVFNKTDQNRTRPFETEKKVPESSSRSTWADYQTELRDLLTTPINSNFEGVKNPLFNTTQDPFSEFGWDDYHQFTSAHCTTCDHLPITNAIEIEEKRKCLKGAIYTYASLAKDLNIHESPLVFELISELRELYITHFDSITPDKVEDARSFIKQWKHIKSQLPGFGG